VGERAGAGRGGVTAVGQWGSEATECAATGASATRAIATRAVGRTFGRSEVTTPEDIAWLVYGHPRNPMRAGRGGSGSPHVLVNARPAVQVSALRDHRVGGDVQADVTLERALPLALAPSLLSRGDLARGACGVRLARERAPVPRGQVSREGRVLRLHPIPPHGTKAHAERRRLALGAARRALWRPRDRPRGVNPFCPTRAFSDEISVARSRPAADASDAIESE
jgi:hypothetical protein